ncbi:uncharacterized protein LOC107040087 [Diachasma alloeum]|uniref:uncharacterized protein LOC107040087 n=1 Tax=Diachasma alloeum TaxID=454923 RepID=UPI00073828AB|nr:uncharacterized protein LOC107040087 [Diachasma alloeum]
MFINTRCCFLLWMFVWGCAVGHSDKALETVDPMSKQDYVDPHSFYYSRHDQKEVERAVASVKRQSQSPTCREMFNDCLRGNLKDVPDELFSRRLINKLLSIATFEEDDDLFIGNIVIELTRAELLRLKSFGLGKATVRDIDAMISNIFRAPKTNVFMDIYSILQGFSLRTHGVYSSYIWPYKELILAFVAVVQLMWLLVRTTWTYFKMFFMFLVIVFIASFIITYLQLLKEAEIKLTAKQFRFNEMPANCQPHKMSWYQKLFSFFTSDDHCIQYYEAVMEDHRFHVTPAQVLSRVIGTLILEPAGLIGRAFADFVYHSTHRMSSPVQWILQPLLLIATIAAVIIGIVFVLSTFFKSLALSPFSFLWNMRTGHSHQAPRNITSKGMREPIEVILNLKVSTDTPGPAAITHSGGSQQLPKIEDKKSEPLKELGRSPGGDADQMNSSLGKGESLRNSSKIDDRSKDEIVHEINHAGGDAASKNVRRRKRGNNPIAVETTDTDDN